MADIQRESQGDRDTVNHGIILIYATDPISNMYKQITGNSCTIIGFFSKLDSELPINLYQRFDLQWPAFMGNSDDIKTLEDLTNIPDIKKMYIGVFTKLNDTDDFTNDEKFNEIINNNNLRYKRSFAESIDEALGIKNNFDINLTETHSIVYNANRMIMSMFDWQFPTTSKIIEHKVLKSIQRSYKKIENSNTPKEISRILSYESDLEVKDINYINDILNEIIIVPDKLTLLEIDFDNQYSDQFLHHWYNKKGYKKCEKYSSWIQNKFGTLLLTDPKYKVIFEKEDQDVPDNNNIYNEQIVVQDSAKDIITLVKSNDAYTELILNWLNNGHGDKREIIHLIKEYNNIRSRSITKNNIPYDTRGYTIPKDISNIIIMNEHSNDRRIFNDSVSELRLSILNIIDMVNLNEHIKIRINNIIEQLNNLLHVTDLGDEISLLTGDDIIISSIIINNDIDSDDEDSIINIKDKKNKKKNRKISIPSRGFIPSNYTNNELSQILKMINNSNNQMICNKYSDVQSIITSYFSQNEVSLNDILE